MISVYYLFEKLSVNQHIYANTELERRLKKEKDPSRKKKLFKARDKASENASMEAWKREPEFMKDRQKDKEARRLRHAAYGQTTRPDLEADLARKAKVIKRKGAKYIRNAKKFGKALTVPIPNLSAPIIN